MRCRIFLFILLFIFGLCFYYLISSYLAYSRLVATGELSSPLSDTLLDYETELTYPVDNPASLIATLANLAAQIFNYEAKPNENAQNQFYAHIEMNQSDIQVISFARKDDLPTQRAIMKVPCVSRKHLYEHLVSEEGYAVLSPVSILFAYLTFTPFSCLYRHFRAP
jgi:hypothetical protein